MNKYKKIIKEKGLKINWVAEKLDIHRTQLSQYINELAPMPISVELRLKEILK